MTGIGFKKIQVLYATAASGLPVGVGVMHRQCRVRFAGLFASIPTIAISFTVAGSM